MTSRLVVNSVRHTGASADALTIDVVVGVTGYQLRNLSGLPWYYYSSSKCNYSTKHYSKCWLVHQTLYFMQLLLV